MGLRDRVTQPYIDAQDRLQNALDLEARAVEFEERMEAAAAAVAQASARADAAVAMADSIIARHEALIAKLEEVVVAKTPVKRALLAQMVKEEVGRINYAELRRAAEASEPYPVRMLSPVSASHWNGGYVSVPTPGQWRP